jgi:hypothetical protein
MVYLTISFARFIASVVYDEFGRIRQEIVWTYFAGSIRTASEETGEYHKKNLSKDR